MSLFSLYTQYKCELAWQFKTFLNYSPTLNRKRGVNIKVLDNLLGKFGQEQRQKLAYLEQRYQLDDWPRLCNQVEYLENLYVLDLLDQYLGKPLGSGTGLDIGCRNFSHLPALSAFSWSSWHGVELDAHARYWNGYSRRAYGEWMAKQRKDCSYIPGSVLELKGGYRYIVWILPFVLPMPLERWGLPMRFFQPLELLQKAWELLGTNGVMLIINQGEVEAAEQKIIFDAIGVKAKSLGKINSHFSPFKNQRYGWEVRKP